MKFSSHLGKGLWAVAVKTLPVINGIATVFLVIRALPEREYGAFVLLQTVFVFAMALANALALTPLIKFAAEREDRGPTIAAALVMNGAFFAAVSLLVLVLREPFARLVAGDGAAAAAGLLAYLPALFATVLYRNFAVALLQASYRLKDIFAIEAVQLLGIPAGVAALRAAGRFETATDLLAVVLTAQTLSSLTALALTRRDMAGPMPLRRDVLGELWRFGRFTFGGTTLYSVFSQLDVLFVSSYGGLVAAATYNAAKVFMRVFDLASQVVQMFLIPFSSKRSSSGDTADLRTAAEKTVAFTTIALLPVVLAMALFPEQILRLLYAEKYVQGAWIVRILSVLGLVTPWSAVSSSCLLGAGRVREGFWMAVGLVAIAIPLYVLLTPQFGGTGTMLGLVTAITIVTFWAVRVLRPLVPLRIVAVARRWRDVAEYIRSLTAGRS
jgi:O-antigen/teichoic acid export membrane protein